MTAADEYLQRPALGRLLTAARAKYEEQGGPRGTVTLADLAREEADALNGLLQPSRLLGPGDDARVSLARLDSALLDSRLELSLHEALTLIGGAPEDRPALRAGRRAAREEAWERVLAHPQAARQELGPWLEHVRRSFGGAAPERAPAVLRALDVLAALPADGVELPRLAATRAGGDAHALDRDRPVGRLVAGALFVLMGLPPGEPRSSEVWRHAWERFGVNCDRLSCTALALGLRPSRAAARAGEPAVVTLRELRRWPLRLAGRALYVCENPAVVATAADALGRGCAPLLCTGGWPNAGVAAVLDAAVEAGMALHVHADHDEAGRAIVRRLLERPGARPWRIDVDGHPAGDVVHEEAVVDALLADLRKASRPGRRKGVRPVARRRLVVGQQVHPGHLGEARAARVR
jgi:uncharacterized protein (TIGR02679 family)